jgi:uncharacterized protein
VVSRRNRLADYGVELRGLRTEIRCGGLGFLASVPPVLVVGALTAPLRTDERVHPFLQLLKETPGGRGVFEIALAAVVTAPLAEELVFRVVFQGLLEQKLPAWAAILIPAVTFAVIHGWPDCLPLLPLAIVLGIVFHRRHSYAGVVTLHAMFNAANLIISLWL